MSFIKEMFKRWDSRFRESVKGDPPKRIAEPVISFVECFKNNPKRFEIKNSFSIDRPYTYNYTLTDRLINKEFTVSCSSYSGMKLFSGVGFELTEDEKEYIFGSIENYYAERRDRYLEIKGQRNRKKLYEIYKQ